MRLFNQTKRPLAWSMGGQRYEVEPWGVVELADELVPHARARGLPLDVSAVAPELRAQVRVADEQAASNEAPIRALKAAAETAQAGEREAKRELEAMSVELSRTRSELRAQGEANATLRDQLARMNADKGAAENLLTETAAQAEAAEARAIKSEALLAEKTDRPAKPKGHRAE